MKQLWKTPINVEVGCGVVNGIQPDGGEFIPGGPFDGFEGVTLSITDNKDETHNFIFSKQLAALIAKSLTEAIKVKL